MRKLLPSMTTVSTWCMTRSRMAEVSVLSLLKTRRLPHRRSPHVEPDRTAAIHSGHRSLRAVLLVERQRSLDKLRQHGTHEADVEKRSRDRRKRSDLQGLAARVNPVKIGQSQAKRRRIFNSLIMPLSWPISRLALFAAMPSCTTRSRQKLRKSIASSTVSSVISLSPTTPAKPLTTRFRALRHILS